MQGIIALWSGAVVDIPFGWKLCDGNNGTPDLRDRFIVGAASAYAVGDNGGSDTHNHTLPTASHGHDLAAVAAVSAGAGISVYVESTDAYGVVSMKNNRPQYYALCYIMHI